MSQDDHDSFENRSRELLAESTGKLDGRTRSRLTQARHAALAQRQERRSLWWRSYLPAGAATAAAVLAVVLWTGPGRDPVTQLANIGNGSSAIEDIDLLADGDAPDFVSEVTTSSSTNGPRARSSHE